jgi:AraC-like DNA-binding protein
MPDSSEKSYLDALIREQRETPVFFRHMPGSYESNVLNELSLTKENKGYDLAIKLICDTIMDYLQTLSIGKRNNNAALRKQLEKQVPVIAKDWIRLFQSPVIIDKPVANYPELFQNLAETDKIKMDIGFDKDEYVKVMLEQIDAIDAEYGITYRKSIFHSHEFFELIYVYAGCCMTTIADTPYELREGDICIYNLQAVHQIELQDDRTVVFNVMISPDHVVDLYEKFIGSTNTLLPFFINSIFNVLNPDQTLLFHRSNESDPERYLVNIISKYYQGPKSNQVMMRALLLPFFTSLSFAYKDILVENSTCYHNERQIDITQILDYINKHYRNVTIKKLAAHFNYSSRNMMRLILKYTNRRFKDIVVQFRIDHACDMLNNSDMSISEIATNVGYAQRSYFDVLFREKCGMTASKYRNKNRLR